MTSLVQRGLIRIRVRPHRVASPTSDVSPTAQGIICSHKSLIQIGSRVYIKYVYHNIVNLEIVNLEIVNRKGIVSETSGNDLEMEKVGTCKKRDMEFWNVKKK